MSTPHEAKRDTRERLLEAARACLLQHGHAACSVKKIAAYAGVNHGLVHHYFGSKEGLWLAMIEREATRVRTSLQRSPDAFVDGFYKPELLRHPDRMRLAVEMLGLAKTAPSVANRLREDFRMNRQAIGQQLGIADAETVTLVFGALFGMAIQSALDPELPVEGAVAHLLDLLRHQQAPHPAAGRPCAKSKR